MIRIEYILLFIIALLSLFYGVVPYLLILLSVSFLAVIFIIKVIKNPEQEWYRCRALAESIKTSSWRFMMRAHPFEDASDVDIPRREFRNLLREILRHNEKVAQELTPDEGDQVTPEMMRTRQGQLVDRINFYVENRIDEQRKWYAKKSVFNRRAFRAWVSIILIAYAAIIVATGTGFFAEAVYRYTLSPLIVLATSMLGWVQMKRHNELAASYNLAAHEIGLIRVASTEISTEEKFSEFVNEAELAFSREHTQWIARRDMV